MSTFQTYKRDSRSADLLLRAALFSTKREGPRLTFATPVCPSQCAASESPRLCAGCCVAASLAWPSFQQLPFAPCGAWRLPSTRSPFARSRFLQERFCKTCLVIGPESPVMKVTKRRKKVSTALALTAVREEGNERATTNGRKTLVFAHSQRCKMRKQASRTRKIKLSAKMAKTKTLHK